jgi:hypothetical protein
MWSRVRRFIRRTSRRGRSTRESKSAVVMQYFCEPAGGCDARNGDPGMSRRTRLATDASVMPWLKQTDVALLGNDGVTDVQPSGIDGVARPIHQLAIVAMGLPLVDVMDRESASEEAGRRHRWEFLLTVAPVPVPGRTGFPINPIATFWEEESLRYLRIPSTARICQADRAIRCPRARGLRTSAPHRSPAVGSPVYRASQSHLGIAVEQNSPDKQKK